MPPWPLEGQVVPCRVALGSQEPPLWCVDPASGPAAASSVGRVLFAPDTRSWQRSPWWVRRKSPQRTGEGSPSSSPPGPQPSKHGARAPALTEAPALCFSQPQLQALHPRRKPQYPLSLRGPWGRV